jgi:hypothetical protein
LKLLPPLLLLHQLLLTLLLLLHQPLLLLQLHLLLTLRSNLLHEEKKPLKSGFFIFYLNDCLVTTLQADQLAR